MGDDKEFIQCSKCFTLNPKDIQLCSKCGAPLEKGQETLAYGDTEGILLDKAIQFTPGQIFDNRYRIIEKIGQGGMGLVYKAEDTELNITVALKIIRPKYSSDPRFIERFKKETLTARSISNDHVIRIYDLGEADDVKYISMEYIKGQSLDELINTSGSLTIETTLNLVKQLCSALKAAHQKGIVHQDLKPSNIMIDNAGLAYIMDFGLAKSFYRKEEGLLKSLIGTPQYMSPEQIRREKIDQRADIYALGAIIYKMLIGKDVYKADSAKEYMRKHVEDIPIPPSNISSQIDSTLEKIILKCLEKDKAQRYQNTDEILNDLNRMIEKKIPPYIRWIKRNWFLPASVALILTASLIIYQFIPTTVQPLTKGKRISLVVTYLNNNSGDKDIDYLGRTFSELLISDLLQSKYIRVITGSHLYTLIDKLEMHDKEKYSINDLQQIALNASAEYVLGGSLTKIGDILRVNTVLYHSNTMEPIGREAVEGTGIEKIFTMVDGLSRRIKEDFNFSQKEIYADIDKDIKSITTNSPKALKHYIDGMRMFYLGKFQDSIELMRKAINFDQEFAMAYLAIYNNLEYMGQPEQAVEYLEKAKLLSYKVSEREYFLIQGAGAPPGKAIESYKKIIELYPDDLTASGLLGALYRNMEEWDLALKYFQNIVEVDDNQPTAHENLAFILMAKGQYSKAREILEDKQKMFGNPVNFHVRRSMTFLCEGKFDLALKDALQIQELDKNEFEGTELEGIIHFIKGDIDLSIDTFNRLMDKNSIYMQFFGKYWLSQLYLTLGKDNQLEKEIESALNKFKKNDFIVGYFNFKILSAYHNLKQNRSSKALEMAHQAMQCANDIDYNLYKNLATHILGLAYIKSDQIEEAKSTAERLKQDIEKSGFLKRLRHYHHLMGETELYEKRIKNSIKCLEKACSLLPAEYSKYDMHILYLSSLASAYYQNGDLEDALKVYKQISSLKTGRIRWGDNYALSFYWMGKIYQQINENQEAIQALKKFKTIWSHADSDLPEIKEAEKMLQSLTETNSQ